MSVSANCLNRDRLLIRFDEMRPLLLALANEKICREIQGKVGASDIVQQTMLEAYQHVHTLAIPRAVVLSRDCRFGGTFEGYGTNAGETRDPSFSTGNANP